MPSPVCDSCQTAEHWDCTPIYDPDTNTLDPCACAQAGHDPAGIQDQP